MISFHARAAQGRRGALWARASHKPRTQQPAARPGARTVQNSCGAPYACASSLRAILPRSMGLVTTR